MAGRSDLVDVEVFKRQETDKAWGFAPPWQRNNLVWVPKSMAEFEEEGPNGKGTLTLPEWLAKEKELI